LSINKKLPRRKSKLIIEEKKLIRENQILYAMNYPTKKLKSILAFSFMICFAFQSFAASWNVPEDQKTRNSYIKFDASTASQGEAIYNANCLSCHGDPGKGNNLKSLNPIPPELSSVGSQNLTDGELLYILNTGRAVMPSFKNSLSEEKMWHVISYLRGFNKNYVQTLSSFDPSKSKLVKLVANFDKAKNAFLIVAYANEKNGKKALVGSEVSLFVKRRFGNLQIDKTLKTDGSGQAEIVFPNDIPGNKTGELEVIVKLFDLNYGEVQTTSRLAIGVPTNKPGLNEQRAIWNVLEKAPYWILFLYSLGVISFLIFILYILNNLRKFRISGNK